MTTYTKRIQSRLSRFGIKKSLPEIREVYAEVVADVENPTEEEIAAIVESFLSSKQEPVSETEIQPVEETTEVIEVENPIQPVEKTTEAEITENQIQPTEEPQEAEEENYTPESSSDLVISDQEKNLEINLQAIELGFALTSEQIAVVADELDNQFVSEDEFIAAVKEELIRFIDYQTEQSNTKFNRMLGEVENYSSGKKVKRLEDMSTNLEQSLTRLQHQDKFFQRRTLSTIDMLRKKKSKSIQV
ncbi:MAG: hypothetical protein KME64_42655 [Scytonematopsis contorta HA4267-MV1]|jgi:hypothetical protein|nr:hypothetical protein [Scytonematopsis contorta HA4267-MV1]